MERCSNCHRPVEAEWAFCEGCGAVLPHHGLPKAAGDAVETPVAPIPLFPESREPASMPLQTESAEPALGRHTPRRWIWPVVLGATITIALGLGTYLYMTLEGARDDLTSTQTDLDRTATSLSVTQDQLAETEGELSETTAERNQLEGKVRSLKADLRGVRGTLNEANADLELQAGQISTLKTCLNGVSIAFDRVLDFDYRGAAAALQSVECACNEAFALI
jgi:hypothetical protein